MSCLTTGYSLNCTNLSSVGGIARIFIANRDDITGITQTPPSSTVTAVTMAATKVFYEITSYPDTAFDTENGTRTEGACNFIYDKEVNVTIPRRNAALRDFIQTAGECCCGFVFILVDENGNSWITGFETNPLRSFRLNTSEGGSGAALTDANQEVLSFTTRSKNKAYPFTGTVPLTP
jgi:hypothetical protein